MDHTFPTASVEEIVQCLREIETDITIENILRPQFEVVRGIYWHLIDYFLGIGPDQLNQPQFSALSTLEFPELHEESIPELTGNRHIMQLMSQVGVNDFSLRDIYKPESGRLIVHLSAVINFAKFRDELLANCKEQTDATDALVETKVRKEEEYQELLSQVQQLHTQRALEEPEVLRMKRQVDTEILPELQKLAAEHHAIKAEVEKLARDSTQLADQQTNSKFILMNTQRECEALQAQIVKSPEKLQQSLKNMTAALQLEKDELAGVESQLKAQKLRSEGLDKVMRAIAKTLPMMKAIEEDQERSKALNREVKAAQQTLSQHQDVLRELDQKEQQLRRQIASMMEKGEAQQQTHAQKATQLQEALGEARSAKAKMEREQAQLATKLAESEAAKKVLEQKIVDAKTDHESALARIKQSQARLEKQVQIYHRDLFAAMGVA